MNCYYCQHTLKNHAYDIDLCDKHPCEVYHYFSIDKLVLIVLVSPIIYKSSKVHIHVDFESKQLWVYYLVDGSYNAKVTSYPAVRQPVTLYKGEIPDHFSPENAIDFINRIVKLQAFL